MAPSSWTFLASTFDAANHLKSHFCQSASVTSPQHLAQSSSPCTTLQDEGPHGVHLQLGPRLDGQEDRHVARGVLRPVLHLQGPKRTTYPPPQNPLLCHLCQGLVGRHHGTRSLHGRAAATGRSCVWQCSLLPPLSCPLPFLPAFLPACCLPILASELPCSGLAHSQASSQASESPGLQLHANARRLCPVLWQLAAAACTVLICPMGRLVELASFADSNWFGAGCGALRHRGVPQGRRPPHRRGQRGGQLPLSLHQAPL